MEVIKANILKAMNEDFTSVYRLVAAIQGDWEINETFESKMVERITAAMHGWAEARRYQNQALQSIIRTATEHKTSIENNLCVDASWLNTSRYEEYNAEAKKFEHEITSLTYFVGLNAKESASVFAKLTSLIKF
jgi:hypothetical protein